MKKITSCLMRFVDGIWKAIANVNGERTIIAEGEDFKQVNAKSAEIIYNKYNKNDESISSTSKGN